MTGMQAGSTVFTIDGGPSGTIEFGTADDARRLREMLERRAGEPMPIILGFRGDTDADVEGHALDQSVALTLQLDDNDTTGHAISVRFPTADDAAKFRRNLVLAGALAATVAIGSAGAIVISGQANAPADSGMWAVPAAVERPAGAGFLEGEDLLMPAVTGVAAGAAVSSIDSATGRPAGTGFLEGVDGGIAERAALPAITRPAGAGPLEGVDE
jgi:hypothetical protein